MAIGTAITVEINPFIAAPIPAICPKGCMAKARKFPNKKPTAKNCKAKKLNRIKMLGFCPDQNKTKKKSAPKSRPIDMVRMTLNL